MFNRTGRAQCPERLSAPPLDTVCFHAYNRSAPILAWCVRNAWQRGGGRIKPVMAAFEGCAEITRMSRCHLLSIPIRSDLLSSAILSLFSSLLFHDSIRRFEDHAWFTIFGFSNWFLLSDGGRIFKKFCREYCCFILWTGTSIRFEDNQIISFRRKIFGKFALVSYTNES